MEKPDVDLIEGLSPAISIEQKTTGSNPRSTVGTVTEIYDYLRLLFGRAALLSLRTRDRLAVAERILDLVMLCPQDARINILAPVVRGRKGEFKPCRRCLRPCRRVAWAPVSADAAVPAVAFARARQPDSLRRARTRGCTSFAGRTKFGPLLSGVVLTRGMAP